MPIRLAQPHDRHDLFSLWQTAPYVHLHTEWQPPVAWLGQPGFVLAEEPVLRPLTFPYREDKVIQGCLAVMADPPPAAWVRVAAARANYALADTFNPLLESVWPTLRAQGVTQVGWLVLEPQTPLFLPKLGFERHNELITYVKDDLQTPPLPANDQITVRPAQAEDIAEVARLDAAAYDPLWRYSEQTLALARPQCLTFDVALWNEQVVGYLFSMSGEGRGGVHLVRLTISPAAQGQGVARSLMNQFLAQCRQHSGTHISLNTQIDNAPSQRLYQRYGFRSVPGRVVVWDRKVG